MPLLLLAFDLTLVQGIPGDVVAVAPDSDVEQLLRRAEEPWVRIRPFPDRRRPCEYERCEIWLVNDDGIALVYGRERGGRWRTRQERLAGT